MQNSHIVISPNLTHHSVHLKGICETDELHNEEDLNKKKSLLRIEFIVDQSTIIACAEREYTIHNSFSSSSFTSLYLNIYTHVYLFKKSIVKQRKKNGFF